MFANGLACDQHVKLAGILRRVLMYALRVHACSTHASVLPPLSCPSLMLDFLVYWIDLSFHICSLPYRIVSLSEERPRAISVQCSCDYRVKLAHWCRLWDIVVECFHLRPPRKTGVISLARAAGGVWTIACDMQRSMRDL